MLKNSYQTLRKMYDGATLALWTSFTFGMTNGIIESQQGGNFRDVFDFAHGNHLERSIYISMTYPFIMNLLSRTSRPKLYSYLVHGLVLTYLYAHHYIRGSPDPIEGMIASSIASTLITRNIINKENKTLENEL